MGFAIEPAIATKILKMQQRVRWRDAALVERGIDQTQLVLDDDREDSPAFSFLVLGDTGSGTHYGHHPQRRIAEQMLAHRDRSRFILHTGDVVYRVGSSEYYPQNFIEPYREFLVGGDQPSRIAYDQMTFNLPFLPIPGNHDYYDLPLLYGVLVQTLSPLKWLLRSRLDFDLGWHGSYQGDAYAHAFLDYLKRFKTNRELAHHLDTHYTASTQTGKCLRYQPGHFTRLPNRYYTFRSGGIDFFALDSNTFNAPLPLAQTPKDDQYRRHLEQQQASLNQQLMEIYETIAQLEASDANDPTAAEQLDDLQAKLEQLTEVQQDITKQLTVDQTTAIDWEQLEWLQQRLIESWHTEAVRGRVLYFHHPPYVTEATKWHQAQTIAVRCRLQQVFDGVAAVVGAKTQGRSIVDLVLNGHAHCLEHLETLDTGHADAHTHWLVCGGSGYSLRRQRQEGPLLTTGWRNVSDAGDRILAKSLLFVGRSGQGAQKHRPYSFARIDVQAGCPPRFVVHPFVSDRFQGEWQDYAIAPFAIG